MSLFDVRHQGHAQRLIQRALTRDRVPHAYIFYGPNGVGKEMLARGLAQVLLCAEPTREELSGAEAEELDAQVALIGCGKCEECAAVAVQAHADLHLIYRRLNRDHPDPTVRQRKAFEIGVDVLRHFLIDKVGLKPQRGRAKVFILREADRITVQAQNALLKTLEEPRGRTVLILLAETLDRLLPTTLSRCQLVRFDPLPTEFVRGTLREVHPQQPDVELDWLARCSDGSIGLALERLGDEFYALNLRLLERLTKTTVKPDELMEVWTEESKQLGGRYRKRDPEISDSEAGRRGLKAVCHLAAIWYADVLRAGCQDDLDIANTGFVEQVRQAAGTVSTDRAVEAIRRIASAERQLDLNANTQLVVETLVNDLAAINAGGEIVVS